MNFQIKSFKSWHTNDGGGYQFNLYLDGKKFAWVHNDGNGGCIDIQFSDANYPYITDTKNGKIWGEYVKSLGQWKSEFGEINGCDSFDHDTDTAIGLLVEQYEINKERKKGILFRLSTDAENAFRIIKTHDLDLATKQLNKMFGEGKYLLI